MSGVQKKPVKKKQVEKGAPWNAPKKDQLEEKIEELSDQLNDSMIKTNEMRTARDNVVNELEALEVELKLTREARDKYAQSQADCSVKLDKAEREVRVMQDDYEELKKKNHGHLQARSEIIAMLEVLIEREIMIKFDQADGSRVESITDLGRQLRVVKEKCFVDGVRRRYNTTGIVHTDLNFEG